MSHNKNHLLTFPITRYLAQLVTQGGSNPRLLPKEMDLCARFGVSRVTVRRAIAGLTERGFILQLPGRRGHFTNPDFARNSECNLGVIVASGFVASMASQSASVLAGFIRTLRPLYCSLDFVSLPSTSVSEVLSTIGNLSLDGLLWISPEDSCMEALDELLACSFPVVGVENPYWANRILPRSNFFCYDRHHAGVLRAEQVFFDGFRHPAFCAVGGVTTDCFGAFLLEHGISFGEERVLSDLSQVSVRIGELLSKHELDCIVCDGNGERYRTVFQALGRHPEGKKVRVYLEREVNSETLASRYSDFDIHYLDNLDMHVTAEHVGGEAGIMMRDMLCRRRSMVFENRSFH